MYGVIYIYIFFSMQYLTLICCDISDHSKTCSEETRGGCEHHCMNVTEGYICACYSGFIISTDNRKKCEGERKNV
jgi:hypothetical protein